MPPMGQNLVRVDVVFHPFMSNLAVPRLRMGLLARGSLLMRRCLAKPTVFAQTPTMQATGLRRPQKRCITAPKHLAASKVPMPVDCTVELRSTLG